MVHNLRMHVDTEMCGLDPESEYVELAVEVFAMLADATRVRIILALRNAEEMSVNHLADVVDKSPAAVSQHLAKLRLARMVSTRREGTTVFYRLTDEHAAAAGHLPDRDHRDHDDDDHQRGSGDPPADR